jgi:hypothetical protein
VRRAFIALEEYHTGNARLYKTGKIYVQQALVAKRR